MKLSIVVVFYVNFLASLALASEDNTSRPSKSPSKIRVPIPMIFPSLSPAQSAMIRPVLENSNNKRKDPPDTPVRSKSKVIKAIELPSIEVTETVLLGAGEHGEILSAKIDRKPYVVKIFSKFMSVEYLRSEWSRQRAAAALGVAPMPSNHGLFFVKGAIQSKIAFAMEAFPYALSLKEFVKSKLPQYDPDKRAKVIQKIAEDTLDSLLRLHAGGLTHQDIAPDNILIILNEAGDYQKMLWIDFGVSGDFEGHPEYHAFESLEVSKSTMDLISMSFVILELLGSFDPKKDLRSKFLPEDRTKFNVSELKELIDLQKSLSSSFKEKLLDTLDANESRPDIMQSFINDNDLYNPAGDGNCFWAALSYALIHQRNIRISAAELKARALKYLQEHQDDFMDFFPGEPQEQRAHLLAYIEAHRHNGEWADNHIIQAVAHAMQINLDIEQHDGLGGVVNYPVQHDPAIQPLQLVNFMNIHFLAPRGENSSSDESASSSSSVNSVISMSSLNSMNYSRSSSSSNSEQGVSPLILPRSTGTTTLSLSFRLRPPSLENAASSSATANQSRCRTLTFRD